MAVGGVASVTEDAIKALEQLKSDLDLMDKQMKKEITRLHDAYDANKDGLGANSEHIRKLLQSMGETVEETSVPVKKLSRNVNMAATIRKKLR